MATLVPVILILIASLCYLGTTLVEKWLNARTKKKKKNTKTFILDNEDVVKVEEFIINRAKLNSIMKSIDDSIREDENELCNNLIEKYKLGKCYLNMDIGTLPIIEVYKAQW